MGASGRVVNSLDFCPASLKSLGCFYFRCVLSSQWKAVTVNLQILYCQLYRHFWRPVVRMCAIGYPKTHFSTIFAIFWSAKKRRKGIFSHPPPPFPSSLCNCNSIRNSRFNFYCYTQREVTPTQKLARKWCCNFLREKLRGAFTCPANQLHWTVHID